MADSKIYSHMTGDNILSVQPNGDELGQPVHGIFEPPNGLLLTAIARNKLLVFACAIILAIVGVVFGSARRPTYTASTTLQIGTVNLNSPGFYGVVSAASSLATVFSRTITAQPVLDELESKLGVTPSEAAQRLSAEPIPLSPSFRIIATGTTPESTISLANTASYAVIAYEEHATKATSPQAVVLLKEYEKAAEQLEHANASVEHLTAEQALHRAEALKEGKTPSDDGPSPALQKARIAQTDARTRAVALETSYRSVTVTNAGANPTSGLLSLVATAATTTNDHSSKIKLYGLIGLLVGLIIGCGLAGLWERRRTAQQGATASESGTRVSEQPV